MSIRGFTPGEYDEERTDTIEAQRIGLGLHPVTGEPLDPYRTEREFDEAQGGLHKAADFLWDVGVNIPLFVGSGFNPQSVGTANALRDKLKGKNNIPWGIGINYGPNDGFGGWEAAVDDALNTDFDTLYIKKPNKYKREIEGNLPLDVIQNRLRKIAEDKGAKDMQMKFQYQGSFDFGPNGEIYWNKIDPAGKVAWQYWLESTAQKSGYASMKDMIKIMREWPDEDYQRFMHELWDGADGSGNIRNRFTYTGYAEHKKAKASKKGRLAKIQRLHPDWNQAQIAAELTRKSLKTNDMDWLHDTEWIDHTGTLRTDGIGLGDRNAPENMLALFDSRWKSLKDVSEQLGYGSEQAPGPLFAFSDGTWRNPKQRFYIDVEDPGKKRKQYLRQSPGDIVIKRADNHKIVGNLGSYLASLYPMDKSKASRLAWQVTQTINPDTGVNFTSLREFREKIILDRINIILRDTNKLPSSGISTSKARKDFIKKNIEDDMINLFEEYPFLEAYRSVDDEIKTVGEGLTDEDFDKRSATPKNNNNNKTKKDVSIGASKAGGTLKEKGTNYIQQKLDDWLRR